MMGLSISKEFSFALVDAVIGCIFIFASLFIQASKTPNLYFFIWGMGLGMILLSIILTIIAVYISACNPMSNEEGEEWLKKMGMKHDDRENEQM